MDSSLHIKISYSAENDADRISASITVHNHFLCILNGLPSGISQVESLGTLGDVLSDVWWRSKD